MKRTIKSFEPDEDVLRMLERTRRDGIKLTFLVNEALRRLLTSKGYARKKDLQSKAA
jgi:hypothetical protein